MPMARSRPVSPSTYFATEFNAAMADEFDAIALFGSFGWDNRAWMCNWEADCREAGCRSLGAALA